MKPFATIFDNSNTGTQDIVADHETADAARAYAAARLEAKDATEVFIFRLEQRARAETVVRFDGGIDTGNGGGDTVT